MRTPDGGDAVAANGDAVVVDAQAAPQDQRIDTDTERVDLRHDSAGDGRVDVSDGSIDATGDESLDAAGDTEPDAVSDDGPSSDTADHPTDGSADGSTDGPPNEKTDGTLPGISPRGWSRSFGGLDDEYATSVAVDGKGNIYVFGEAPRPIDLGTGPICAYPITGLFLIKFAPAGDVIWARCFSGQGNPFGNPGTLAVVADDIHGVIITGTVNYLIDFGGGPLDAPGSNINDAFVAKFSTGGEHLWSMRLGGVGGDGGVNLAFDSTGNVIVVGYFQSSLAGVMHTASGATATVMDGSASSTFSLSFGYFVLKLSPAGQRLWARGFGAGVWGLAIDANDQILIAGSMYGTGSYGGGVIGTPNRSSMGIAKFSTSGEHLWSKAYGDPRGSIWGTHLVVNTMGQIYVAGGFSGTVDLGGGDLVRGPATAAGDSTPFWAKFSSEGAHTWSSRGSTGTGPVGGLALDPLDNVILLHRASEGTVVQEATVDGAPIWTKRFAINTLTGAYGGRDLAVDSGGNVVMVGTFDGDILLGNDLLAGQGGYDAFVFKFAP